MSNKEIGNGERVGTYTCPTESLLESVMLKGEMFID